MRKRVGMEIIVRAENLCRFYNEGRSDEVRALDGVDLEIERGGFVVLTGASGSGKTTLLNLIGAMDRPSTGKLYLDGEDLFRLSDDAMSRVRRSKVGMVFQSFGLLPRLPAWENVAAPLIPEVWSASQRFERARELLSRLHMEDRLLHPPEQLSGGQRQRVAVARALVYDPDLLLADEPTSNLDARAAEELREILLNLNAGGKTIVAATHDPELLAVADTIFELREGKLARTTSGSRRAFRAASISSPIQTHDVAPRAKSPFPPCPPAPLPPRPRAAPTREDRKFRSWEKLAIALLLAILIGLPMGIWGYEYARQDISPGMLLDRLESVVRSDETVARRGNRAPDFTLRDLSGTEVRLSELQGHVVLLVFWNLLPALCCSPIAETMLPSLQRTYMAYRDRGMIALAVNPMDAREEISDFRDGFGLTYPFLIDSEGAASRTYWVKRFDYIPTCFVLDGDGVIREKIRGELNQKELSGLLSALLR